MKRRTLKTRALLVALAALAASSCVLAARVSAPPAPTATTSTSHLPSPTTTTVTTRQLDNLATTTDIKVPSLTTATTTTTTQAAAPTTTTTQLAQKLASQQPLAQQQQQPATTTTTTTTAAVPTTSQQTSPQTTAASQFQSLRPRLTAPTAAPAATQPAAPVCQHNNVTHPLGATWNDDCLQVCECVPGEVAPAGANVAASLLAVSACRPRCPVYPDPPGDRCRMVRDPQDECCLAWNCELEVAKVAPSAHATEAAGVSSSDNSPSSSSSSTSSPPQTTTRMQTERGELSMSTTEIRMPTSTTSTTSTTTTTTPAPTTTIQTSAAPPVSSRPPQPTTTQQQVPRRQPATIKPPQQPATSTVRTTTTQQQQQQQQQTTLASRRPPVAPAGNAREPKQVGQAPVAQQRGRPADMTRSVDGASTATLPPTPLVAEIDEITDPTRLDLCIITVEDNKVPSWQVNASWSTACANECRCAFRSDPPEEFVSYVRPTLNLRPGSNQTEIRCGPPAACEASLLRLRAECAAPLRLKRPAPATSAGVTTKDDDDNFSAYAYDSFPPPQGGRNPSSADCACPEFVCDNKPLPLVAQQQQQQQPLVPTSAPSAPPPTQRLVPIQTTTTTTPTTTTSASDGARCTQPGGRAMAPGESFQDECHSVCRCSPAGVLRCEPLNCPGEPPSDHLCVEWAPAEANFKPDSGAQKCCPEFVCRIPVALEPIVANATTGTPPPSSLAPATASAAAADERLVVVESSASSSGRTSSGPTTTTGSGDETSTRTRACTFLGKVYEHGARLPEQVQGRPSDLEHAAGEEAAATTCEKECTCQDAEIVCRPVCPPPSTVVVSGPSSPEDCPLGTSFQPVTAQDQLQQDTCCGGVVAPVARYTCQEAIVVTPVNGTAVEIVFKLPEFAIRRRGRIELNFTQLPLADREALEDEPPAHAVWVRRPKIRTPDGVFSAPHIKYYWTGLQPNSKYWFRLVLRYDSGESVNLSPPPPLESAIQSFVMSPTGAGDEDLEDLPSITTTTQAVTSTTTTTASPPPPPPSGPPTRTITPKLSTTRAPAASSASTSTTTPSHTTTSTTTTTTGRPSVASTSTSTSTSTSSSSAKPEVFAEKPSVQEEQPCDKSANADGGGGGGNRIDLESRQPQQPWGDFLHQQVQSAPIQRYAWHLVVALSVMTTLFVIVSYLYFKKSTHMVAPITTPYKHQNAFHHSHHHHHNQASAYDNPTFTTRLVSYNANQPRVLLVDESYQNLDNLTRQKNMEVDQASPLHHQQHNRTNGKSSNNSNNNNNNNNNSHTTTLIQHQNGRQNLI